MEIWVTLLSAIFLRGNILPDRERRRCACTFSTRCSLDARTAPAPGHVPRDLYILQRNDSFLEFILGVNVKPVFKVHHVSHPATYDLDTVHKQIKGQPIAASLKNNVQGSHRLVLAATYKFKPVALVDKQKLLGSKAKSHTYTTLKQKSPSTQQSTTKTNCVTGTKSRVKNQESQPSTSGARCESQNDRSRRRHSTRHRVKGED